MNSVPKDPYIMAVAFSSLARIWGALSTMHSLPALFFFFFKVEIT